MASRASSQAEPAGAEFFFSRRISSASELETGEPQQSSVKMPLTVWSHCGGHRAVSGNHAAVRGTAGRKRAPSA